MVIRHEAHLPIRPNGDAAPKFSPVHHPLEPLSAIEFERARQSILLARGSGVVIKFRAIFLAEPPKKELIPFLDAENAGEISLQTSRPDRLAMVHYDVIQSDESHEYTHSLVDVSTGQEREHRVIDKMHQAAMTR